MTNRDVEYWKYQLGLFKVCTEKVDAATSRILGSGQLARVLKSRLGSETLEKTWIKGANIGLTSGNFFLNKDTPQDILKDAVGLSINTVVGFTDHGLAVVLKNIEKPRFILFNKFILSGIQDVARARGLQSYIIATFTALGNPTPK